MKSSNFKFSGRWSAFGGAALFAVLLLLIIVHRPLTTVQAHEGEDHSKDAKTTTAATQAANAQPISIVSAERNVEDASGNFNFLLKRSPGDARFGETVQFALKIAEKIEGGFGGGAPLAVEKARVSASVTEAGKAIAENLPVTAEAGGIYRTNYEFGAAGNYKIVFNATTEDGRQVSVDFPITISSAPIRSSFLAGLLVLSLLTLGSLAAVFYAAKKRGAGRINYRQTAPFAVAAVVIFAVGLFALMYFLPARETRVAAQIAPEAMNAPAENALTAAEILTVPKESQILFGVKTAAVETRNIVAGLKVNGTVRAKPDARALITPPVAGRIVLNSGIAIGAAVGRGEQIGYVEQILDVSGQTELESQRLEVEAQQREIEARRLEIKNSVLQLQAQQADQRANAQQARTRLAQAQRELRRSENLVEVGAVPKKRVEEAQTAVRVAEQEVASSERQIVLLENQIKQTGAGQNIFRAPRVNQPNRTFPLTAPVTGTITQINATSGQQVETGTEIASIVNLNTVLLEAQIFERDLAAARESEKASFTNAALNGEVYTIGTPDGDGRLVSVGQTVDAQTRAVPIIYEVKNPLNRLREGMFVEITIDTSGDREALAVPKQAVVTEQGQTFVFVFDGGETFEKRPVRLGAEGADFYEVVSGLKAGERVVTEGVYQLRSTQPGA